LRVLSGLFTFNEPYQAATTAIQAPYLRYAWLDVIEVLTARDQAGPQRRALPSPPKAATTPKATTTTMSAPSSSMPWADRSCRRRRRYLQQKNFSGQRYDLWAMQSAYHSLLPVLDGVQQLPGGRFRASAVQATDNVQESSLAWTSPVPTHPKPRSRPGTAASRSSAAARPRRGRPLPLREPVKTITLRLLTPSLISEDAPGKFRLRTQACPMRRRRPMAL
jgi:hypothetical protein